MKTSEFLSHVDEVIAEEEPKLNTFKLILPTLAQVIPLPVNEDFEGVA